jgi:tetratricopeptide (TPR) repeat protein
LTRLARLLAYRGAYQESEVELTTALEAFEKGRDLQAQGMIHAYRAFHTLLRLRQAAYDGHPGPQSATLKLALASASHALELADEDARSSYPVELDYVRAHWVLGAAHRVAGQVNKAERHLLSALERCRRTNMVDHEADILIDLARLRAVVGAEEEAQRLADEARVIAERSGYVFQGADAHLELARLSRARGDRNTARQHASEARRLATCDGPPDYTYAAAYAESGALLDSL